MALGLGIHKVHKGKKQKEVGSGASRLSSSLSRGFPPFPNTPKRSQGEEESRKKLYSSYKLLAVSLATLHVVRA